MSILQAAFHTQIQLTLPASNNELSMYLVAHFPSEPLLMPTVDSFNLSLATMIALISISQSPLNLGDALLVLCRTDRWCRYSIGELFSTLDQVFLDLVAALTLAWISPLETAPIAELGTITATSRILLLSKNGTRTQRHIPHMVATPLRGNQRAAREATLPFVFGC